KGPEAAPAAAPAAAINTNLLKPLTAAATNAAATNAPVATSTAAAKIEIKPPAQTPQPAGQNTAPAAPSTPKQRGFPLELGHCVSGYSRLEFQMRTVANNQQPTADGPNLAESARALFRFLTAATTIPMILFGALFISAGCARSEKRADIVILNGGEPE